MGGAVFTFLSSSSSSVVVMLCGGNIDTAILGRCLERGLAADGRMATFKILLEDRPGSVSGLCDLLSQLKCRSVQYTYTQGAPCVLSEDNVTSFSLPPSLLPSLSVKDIMHERTWLQASVHHVEV